MKLLQSASLAVKALASPKAESAEALDQSPSLERQKESFTAAASQYFTLLSSIDARLRRQISALEEAEIIPAEVTTRESQSSLLVPGTNTDAITGGGLGSLDVGWLNSRNDHVGKEKEAELWEEAQKMVEKLEKDRADGKEIDLGAKISSGQREASHGDEQMDQT